MARGLGNIKEGAVLRRVVKFTTYSPEGATLFDSVAPARSYRHDCTALGPADSKDPVPSQFCSVEVGRCERCFRDSLAIRESGTFIR